jgi:uncharacterized membrane protein HdeD (DUF308 family)
MISLFLGIIAFIGGLFFLVNTWEQFINFLYGFLPISIVLAGLIAIIAGISSIKDNINSKHDEEKLNKEK